jgi:hypothetical protein
VSRHQPNTLEKIGSVYSLYVYDRNSQQRPRVSKLKAMGLSDYHSSETVVEAARWGVSGRNERATLMTCLLKKGELKKSSSLLD